MQFPPPGIKETSGDLSGTLEVHKCMFEINLRVFVLCASVGMRTEIFEEDSERGVVCVCRLKYARKNACCWLLRTVSCKLGCRVLGVCVFAGGEAVLRG